MSNESSARSSQPVEVMASQILFIRDQKVMIDADLAAHYGVPSKQLNELEEKTEALAFQHDTIARNPRAQLKQVFDAIRQLMIQPDPPKRPIGFITPEDKAGKPKAVKSRA